MPNFPTELRPIFAPMTNADLTPVMEMEHVSFPTPWSIDTYRRELIVHNASYWVVRPTVKHANIDGEIPPVLAYGGMWLLGEDAHITTFATHPDWRRRHIGEWLLINMVDVARSHRVSALTLEVRLRNTAAQALYAKLGFVAVGLRRGYYQDTGEDARLLTLFAIDHATVWEKLRARMAEIEGGEV
jgi:[ribosomal protein S18]-alanine N-acetyltransferase